MFNPKHLGMTMLIIFAVLLIISAISYKNLRDLKNKAPVLEMDNNFKTVQSLSTIRLVILVVVTALVFFSVVIKKEK